MINLEELDLFELRRLIGIDTDIYSYNTIRARYLNKGVKIVAIKNFTMALKRLLTQIESEQKSVLDMSVL